MQPRAPRVGEKCRRQVGGKSKLMRPRAPRVGDKCARQVGDKWDTIRRKVGDKCRRQVGDKCKLMRPRARRVEDKCGRQVGDKCNLMRPRASRVGDKWETSANSYGPEHPEWETSVGDKCWRQVEDKCKLMRPRAPRVGDKCAIGATLETMAFALNDLSQVGPFPPLPSQPPDAYRLSLGKITETLRLDYQEFFDRKPDFSIYDPAVVLQLRKPWNEPKQMAGCKQTYVTMVKAMRTFCKKFLHGGTVDCQVCDGRPYGCDLRVHWTCKGQVNWIGETSVMISAISLYTLKHCDEASTDGI
eukprot:s3885_g3.t1